ncbi:MFS transporter [Clostridium lundense]|uniref:MFS transporter n=1 Tax=Clostridium lundense TaxID=319475 RepID=UPI000485EB50|nr:MFS transporter [Clostridium lundense]
MNKIIHKIIEPYKGLPKEIYIIFISRIVNSLGSFVYPLLTLILTQKIGISVSKTGIFMTCISLLSAPGMLIGGKLVDSFGRKKTILIFQSLALIVFIICGFLKPSMKMAYTLMMAPIFYSFCMPAQDSIVADLTTPNNRNEAFSLLYMGHNLGFSIGPVIGGLLYKNHLSFVFWGDAFTTIISLTLILFFIEETSNLKINKKEEWTLEKEEKGSVFKILYERIILIYFALILFVYQFAYSQWAFLLPLQLSNIFGQEGGKYFGFLAGFNGFIIICSTSLISGWTRKMNCFKSISFGGILYSISFLVFAVFKSTVYFFISIAIMTIGEVIVAINTPVVISNNSPASHRGRINGVLPTIYGAGWAVGPIIMGKFSSRYGIEKSWITIFAAILIASMFMRLLAKVNRGKITNSY